MQNKATVIACVNQKGGTGKTCTAENLGIGMVQEGKKVLLVDMDPQASLTISLGYPRPDDLPVTVSDQMAKVMQDMPVPLKEGILTHEEGVDLMPASIALSGLEVSLVNAMSRESILKQYLEPLKKEYDFIILDCMPSLGMLTVNALAAADQLVVPVQAQYLSAKGLEQLLQTVNKVKRQINPKLRVEGILLTMVDSRTNNAKEIASLIREDFCLLPVKRYMEFFQVLRMWAYLNTKLLPIVSVLRSAISTKVQVARVEKHNTRAYSSDEYDRSKIIVLRGTGRATLDNIKRIYHEEFDKAIDEYNEKMIKAGTPERQRYIRRDGAGRLMKDKNGRYVRISDPDPYFNEVSNRSQTQIAIEIIVELGDRDFWAEKSYEQIEDITGQLKDILEEVERINAENERLANRYNGNYGFVKTAQDAAETHSECAQEDIESVLDIVFRAVSDIEDSNILILQGRDIFVQSVKKNTTAELLKTGLYKKLALKDWYTDLLGEVYMNMKKF